MAAVAIAAVIDGALSADIILIEYCSIRDMTIKRVVESEMVIVFTHITISGSTQLLRGEKSSDRTSVRKLLHIDEDCSLSLSLSLSPQSHPLSSSIALFFTISFSGSVRAAPSLNRPRPSSGRAQRED